MRRTAVQGAAVSGRKVVPGTTATFASLAARTKVIKSTCWGRVHQRKKPPSGWTKTARSMCCRMA